MPLTLQDYEVFKRSSALFELLVVEGYPLEIIDGLRAIADALIETEGFEPIFWECVARAREHVTASRNGYNLPAKVAA